MTKLTFDVDFTKDPEQILREIQEQAKQEVAKRESKEKANAYLANLHESVNKEIGTSYKSTDDLIRALSAFSKSGSIRTSSAKVSATGRRVTISMTQEIFDEIKSKLSQPNPNKAAIARETGVSVVQVRKVATGGFDSKFGGGAFLHLNLSQNRLSLLHLLSLRPNQFRLNLSLLQNFQSFLPIYQILRSPPLRKKFCHHHPKVRKQRNLLLQLLRLLP